MGKRPDNSYRPVMWYPWSWTTQPFLSKLAEGKIWRTLNSSGLNQSIAFRFQGITKNILELDLRDGRSSVASDSYYGYNGPIPINTFSHEPKEGPSLPILTSPKIDLKMLSPYMIICPCFPHGNPGNSPHIFRDSVGETVGPAGKLQLPGASPASGCLASKI